MAGEVVPLKPKVDDETKRKQRLLEWRNSLAEKVLKAVREDAALHFLDNVDDEEGAAFDLKGEFNPIVDEKTGARLTDAIMEFAEEIKYPEKMLWRLYKRTLKEKFEAQRVEIPTEPAGKPYGRYLVNRHGVWTRQSAGAADLFVWRRIARTRIDPVALSRDTSSQRNWRHRYLITDETGEFPVEIGKEKLGKRADPAISILMKHGVHVVESDEARRHLATFLRFKPLGRIIRAPHVGWFEARKGNWVFVLPTETLGDVGEKHDITLDAAPARHGFHRSGTSEQWRENVAKPLTGNSNVLLAVGTFLAAPLLRWADEAGGGTHIFGHSKLGKTLVSAIGQSVWGKPCVPGAGEGAFGFTWESTPNRIGERAVLRSDVGLALDEISSAERKAVGSTIYKLAGGVDKGRYRQPERTFNILLFSTGEKSLLEFLPNVQQGQLVRLADISAEVQAGSAFETIPESKIDVAARQFYAAVNDYHGTIGHEWLEHLVASGPMQIKAELKRLREAWRALPEVAEISSRAHPQVMSVINRFALIAAALNMASAAGVVPWTVADIDAGIIACMRRWLQQHGNIDVSGELLRGIKRCRQLLAATIEDRFIRLVLKKRRLVPASAADRRKMAVAQQFDGYVKDGRILVLPDAWRRLWAGLDIDAVKQHLLDAKLLIPSRDGVVPSAEKINGKPTRVYVLAGAFVDDVTV